MEDNKKWYALSVLSNQEKKVKEYINSELIINNVEEYIEDIRIPLEKKLVLRNGKKHVQEKVRMPGYILIKADLGNQEVANVLKKTNGVTGFISERNDDREKIPQPLSDEDVKKFLTDAEYAAQQPNFEYVVGDRVEIHDGPFKNFRGEVQNVNEDKKQIDVSVNIFNRPTPVKLNYGQVEKIKNSDEN